MLELKYRTHGNANPQGKPRVYFTCHPSDFDRCFERLIQDIFSAQDCAVFYTADMSEAVPQEDRELQLKRMNLFVIPVSLKLLIEPNRALDEDFPFAVENKIPVLPIVVEAGLDPIYSRKDRFADRNYLLLDGDVDSSGLSYESKLQRYLHAVLVDDQTADRVRAAFDCYVFLSYRKKDRKYADELMRLIHRNPACRDVAIWYDEYLTPGEGFSSAIETMITNSKLFTLLVTPNLVNEENYVQTDEYPAAKKAKKPVFPAEMEATDRAALEQQYEGIPACAAAEDADAFYSQLLDTLRGIALRKNDSDPVHNYLIGLAYLDGIDVEVDRERALELITSAAKAELPEAMERLCELYFQGIGIPIDYKKACQWARKVLLMYSTKYGEDDSKTLQAANTLALIYEKLGDYEIAAKILEKRYSMQCISFGEKSVDALLTMCDLGRIYANSGNSKRALELCIKAFLGLSDILDEDSIETAFSLSMVAYVYGKTTSKNYSDQIKYLEFAYKKLSHILGKNSPKTVSVISLLASAYGKAGDNEKARRLGEYAYELMKNSLGANHPDTLSILNDLALTYGRLGDYQQQLKLQTIVFNHRHTVLGDDHPDTVRAVCNLAATYGALKEYKTEIKYYEKACLVAERVLGENHTETLYALNSLVSTYTKTGNDEKALELQKKLYGLYCKAHGEGNPNTVALLNNLACTYCKLGNYEKSLEILDKVYALCSKDFGEEHLNTAHVLNNLATTYYEMGEHKKALEIEEKVYELRCKVLGEEHPDTLTSLEIMAGIYDDLGNYEMALYHAKKLYTTRRRVFGNEHPATLTALNNLALTFRNIGDLKAALESIEKALETSCKTLGEEDPGTLLFLNNLAIICSDLGDLSRAKGSIKKVLAVRTKNNGENHPNTLEAKANLALILDKSGDAEEALRLCDEILNTDAELTRKTVQRVSEIYEHHGQAEKAERIRSKKRNS